MAKSGIPSELITWGIIGAAAYFAYEWLKGNCAGGSPSFSFLCGPIFGTAAPVGSAGSAANASATGSAGSTGGSTGSGAPPPPPPPPPLTCTAPQILNAAGNACVNPPPPPPPAQPVIGTQANAQVTQLQAASGGASTLNVDQWSYYWQQTFGATISPSVVQSMINAEGGDRSRPLTAGQFVQLFFYALGQLPGLTGLSGLGMLGYQMQDVGIPASMIHSSFGSYF